MTARRLVYSALLVLWTALPAASYLHNRTGTALDHWTSQPISYMINPAHGSNISGGRSVQDVVVASFQTWAAAPNTALSFQRLPDTTRHAPGDDGFNLICFDCKIDSFKDASTLALTITSTVTDGPNAGQITDADMLFNPNTAFNTDSGTAVQDLQSVATHEAGHFLGLDHSSVVRAIMFPYAPDEERTLSWDDVAAISVIYPAGARAVTTGSISGAVRKNGAPVFGAHVFAESVTATDPFAGFNVRKSPIGNLTLPDGSYRLDGVPFDQYVVYAEPLDKPSSNSNVSGYPGSFNRDSVDTGFTTRPH